MMHVVVGTDTYGRVKAVGKAAVVTRFSMAQMLPVWPLGSYYVRRTATSETSGVPFVAEFQNVTIHGLPLARVDRTSVAVAYVRAVLASLVLFGFIGTLMGLTFSLNGKRMDDFALTATQLAETCLATGIVGGLLTYLVPTVSRREQAIRMYCGELLGMCIDPGRVEPKTAAAIREALPIFDNPGPAGAMRLRSGYVRALILTRCQGAISGQHGCEATTDELLDCLRHLDRDEMLKP